MKRSETYRKMDQISGISSQVSLDMEIAQWNLLVVVNIKQIDNSIIALKP